jgi:hypothetical protein
MFEKPERFNSLLCIKNYEFVQHNMYRRQCISSFYRMKLIGSILARDI